MVVLAGQTEAGKIATLVIGVSPNDIAGLLSGKKAEHTLGAGLPNISITMVPSDDEALQYVKNSCVEKGRPLTVVDHRQTVVDPT